MLLVLTSIISIVNECLLKLDTDQVYEKFYKKGIKKPLFLSLFEVLRFLLR